MEDVMEDGAPADGASNLDLDRLPQPKAADLSEADLRGCRWVENDPLPLRAGMFCCRSVSEPGGSWCLGHRERVWRLAKRRGSAA
jgi:hypothetical protein